MTTDHLPQVKSRITLVDALRGFALMGLFIVHMVEYFELYWYRPEPGWVHDTIFFLFGGKAYAIFALLFGLSFYIIINNQAKQGRDFRLGFAWRLIILAMFGYLHGLIYSGDILLVLAILGLPVIALYKISNKWLLIIAGLFLLQIPLFGQLYWLNVYPDVNSSNPLHYELMGTSFKALATGSFTDVLVNNSFTGQWAKMVFMFESGRAFNIIGLILMGIYLGRIQFFELISDYKKACLVIATSSMALVLTYYIVEPDIASWGLTGLSLKVGHNILGNYLNNGLMVLGILLFILAYQFDLVAKLLNLLAAPGRMSLSFYIFQSLLGAPLFYYYGMGLFDSIGQQMSLLLGIGLWILQIALAQYWIKRFYYGPFEWLWRAATYFNTQITFKR